MRKELLRKQPCLIYNVRQFAHIVIILHGRSDAAVAGHVLTMTYGIISRIKRGKIDGIPHRHPVDG